VKLLKFWRDRLPTESCKLKSYILESLIQRRGSPSSHAAAVVNVIEGIENTYGAYRNTGAVPTISDPGYASVNLANH
jgi:acid phosphatase family membrane protein YuiD